MGLDAVQNGVLVSAADCGLAVRAVEWADAPEALLAIGSTNVTYALAIHADRAVAGTYALCWAYAPAEPSDHRVRVAMLSLAGPFRGEYACTLGVACAVRLDGVGLAGSSRSPNPGNTRYRGHHRRREE